MHRSQSRTGRLAAPIPLVVLALVCGPGDRPLAQQFKSGEVLIQSLVRPNCVLATDLDGDGDRDVLSGSFFDGRVAWNENVDGLGTFGPLATLGFGHSGVRDVDAADLDGDGTRDVVAVSFNSGVPPYSADKVAWYSNMDGVGGFGAEKVVSTTDRRPTSVVAVDLDGDGDADLLTALQYEEIGWFPNLTGTGSFGSMQIFTTALDRPLEVQAVDIDLDGDLDVASASRDDDRIAWFENVDGMASFGPMQTVTTEADAAISVFSADVDADGDPDLLSASIADDKIAWYRNLDGLGGFGGQVVVTTLASSAEMVRTGDFDGDGSIDAVSAAWANDTVAWFANPGSFGRFGPPNVVSTSVWNPTAIDVGDLDGDDDPDVLSAAYYGNHLYFHRNADGKGTFASKSQINPSANGASSVFVGDFDSDGDGDILCGAALDARVGWFENLDGAGSFSGMQVLTDLAIGASSVTGSDLDGDGDLDALAGARAANMVAWFRNTDGAGSFGPPSIIAIDAMGVESVAAADLDGDGHQDVLAAPPGAPARFVWYRNRDGNGGFAQASYISPSECGPVYVDPADMDGDGDLDVVGAVDFCERVVWYENLNGLGTQFAKVALTQQSGGQRAVARDLDGDGDRDILYAAASSVAWWENVDGAGSFGVHHSINSDVSSASAVDAADLDGDGDLDVMAASSSGSEVLWFENPDGLGSFYYGITVTTQPKVPTDLAAGDLTGDGKLDIVVSSSLDGKITWFENFADCNGNGVEDGIDLALGTSEDFDGDGVPDECEPDCDGDGLSDELELATGLALDCNGDGVPDVCDVPPCSIHLASSTHELSVSSGGGQALHLTAGPVHVGRDYLVLGSLSGTSPGVGLGQGLVLPLVPDAYFMLTLQDPSSSSLSDAFGTLDHAGHHQITFFLPPMAAALVGSTFHHAALVFSDGIALTDAGRDSGGVPQPDGSVFAATSNSVPLLLLP